MTGLHQLGGWRLNNPFLYKVLKSSGTNAQERYQWIPKQKSKKSLLVTPLFYL